MKDGQQLQASARNKSRCAYQSACRPQESFGVWMTAATAAVYLDFSHCQHPVHAFRQWVAAVHPAVIPARRGRVPLYARRDLDAAIRGGRKVKSAHVQQSRPNGHLNASQES